MVLRVRFKWCTNCSGTRQCHQAWRSVLPLIFPFFFSLYNLGRGKVAEAVTAVGVCAFLINFDGFGSQLVLNWVELLIRWKVSLLGLSLLNWFCLCRILLRRYELAYLCFAPRAQAWRGHSRCEQVLTLNSLDLLLQNHSSGWLERHTRASFGAEAVLSACSWRGVVIVLENAFVAWWLILCVCLQHLVVIKNVDF